MKRLELFKPLMMLKDSSNPVLFDEIGIPYTNKWGSDKGLRPFVIFYDESDDTYWYIKSRGAFAKNKEYKQKQKGEILMEEADIGLFGKESYIDCSQIFKIDANLLESLVDKEAELYKRTTILNKNQQKIILNKINECVNEEPPYLSILEVYKMGDKLKGVSQYLCPEKYKDLEQSSQKDLWDDSSCKILYNAEIEPYGLEYLTALEFKKKFQEKYFPNPSLKIKM